ncbi:hypothetical protein [Pedobacter sp. Leaf194]|uniref:hypothetical protein n=1 Tax=Pedobacter sp. Leaf194 TaxID=1736297 RepID=UPI0007038313|nr:hypothetical protein [Pedobacter sp. Leaf194]KQS35647.1 hypothetical protein ASG14_09220 [Pedobacter sp. Leaf194]
MKGIKATIRTWLLNVINDGSWQRFNDLHIDEISRDFSHRAAWFSGGVACYIHARAIIEELDLPFTVELVFHLKSKKKKIDHIFKRLSALDKNLDDTPPSLYVFRNDWKGLHETRKKGTKLQDFADDKILKGSFYYFQVFNDDDNDIRRVLYLI